jgi:hypothetical protein
MENRERSNGLQINENTLYYWQQMTKWTKFFGILGFVLAGLYGVLCLWGLTAMLGSDEMDLARMGLGGLVYLVFAMVIAFIVVIGMLSLNHLRFTEQMRAAINTNNQEALESAWRNMSQAWRTYGYASLMLIVLYVVILVVAGSNMVNIFQGLQGM